MKTIIFSFLFLFSFGGTGCVLGQDSTSFDIELVKSKAFEQSEKPKPSKAKFGLIGKSFVSKYNPVSLLLSSALFTYQKVMSGQIASNCPYQLSCSNFAKASLSEFGLFKGTALAVDRMLRCNKLSTADVHPVRFNDRGKVADFPTYYRLEH